MESAPRKLEYNDTGKRLIGIIDAVRDVVTNLDPNAERSDLRTYTWDELRSPSGEYGPSEEKLRRTAYNGVRAAYMAGIMDLYPSLREITSEEDMLLAMAMIPDLPECNALYRHSDYVSESGASRVLTHIDLHFGGDMVMRRTLLIDLYQGVGASYKIGTYIDGQIRVGKNVYSEDELMNNALLEKVPASQASNLRRVLFGRVESYELESMLTEIRIGCETEIIASELDELLDDARVAYHKAIENRRSESKAGKYNMDFQDLDRIELILAERVEQLRTGA